MLNKLFNIYRGGLNPLYNKFNEKNRNDVETINMIIQRDKDININPVTLRDMEVLGLKRLFDCYTVSEIFKILRYYQGGQVKREPVERWQPVHRADGKINCNSCLYLKKGRGNVYCEFYKKMFSNDCEHFFNKRRV